MVLADGMVKQPDAAGTSPWARTFVADDLASFNEQGDSVVLIGVGASSASRQAALTALQSALAAHSSAIEMHDTGLSGAASTDERLLSSFQDSTAKRVWILRLLENGKRFVATIYDRDGRVVAGFSGRPGERISRKSAGGLGVSREAQETVARIAERQPTRASAIEEYERRAVWFEEWAGVARTGALLRWTVPYKGKFKEPLKGAAFYEYVGREELAEEYASNSSIRGIVSLAGFGAIVGGVYYNRKDRDGEDLESLERRDHISTAIVLGGLIAAVGAAFWDPNPVDGPELRRLADEFNTELRKELGLSREEVNFGERWRSERSIEPPSLTPFIAEGGGGLQLGMRF